MSKRLQPRMLEEACGGIEPELKKALRILDALKSKPGWNNIARRGLAAAQAAIMKANGR